MNEDYFTSEKIKEKLQINERDYQEIYRRAQEGEMSGELFATLCVISTLEKMMLSFQRDVLNNIKN